MAWKLEKWLSEVFPGEDNIYSEYRHLRGRELAIVSVAVLDVALAELITLRLADVPNEAESFLGLNEDGRAPAASFGARIQLAWLLGLLMPEDVAVLRAMKGVRNVFAHRVKVTYLSPRVQKPLLQLWEASVAINTRISHGNPAINAALQELRGELDKVEDAGEGMMFATFCVYQAYFHRLHGRIQRLGNALV